MLVGIWSVTTESREQRVFFVPKLPESDEIFFHGAPLISIKKHSTSSTLDLVLIQHSLCVAKTKLSTQKWNTDHFKIFFNKQFWVIREFLPFRVLQDKSHVELFIQVQINVEEYKSLISGQVSQGEGNLV